MIRQKPAKEESVKKTIAFLKDLKYQCNPDHIIHKTISELHAEHEISTATASACKKLGIIIKANTGFTWLAGEPDRKMALQVLDLLLQKSKKPTTQQWLIPEMADMLKSIGQTIEATNINIVQTNNILKGRKHNAGATETIFTSQEQRQRDRVYLAGQIANAAFSHNPHYITSHYETVNSDIVTVTDNLLDKLNK